MMIHDVDLINVERRHEVVSRHEERKRREDHENELDPID
jgi:hypothetical protein